MRRFATGAVPGIHEDAAPFFRDVFDHLTKVAEEVDSLDQLLSTAFDAHLAQIQVTQNEDMRKISAGVGLVVVPTLIAGVYGMNFQHMPELGWQLGYPFALLLMVASVSGLWIWFKRSGWL
jgi:magnesium transporter